jgi:hypothetical protein
MIGPGYPDHVDRTRVDIQVTTSSESITLSSMSFRDSCPHLVGQTIRIILRYLLSV